MRHFTPPVDYSVSGRMLEPAMFPDGENEAKAHVGTEAETNGTQYRHSAKFWGDAG